jgi:molecular chaperone HtpG
MTTTAAPESQPFQAEVAELLHLMVHSVYSETDIFLRELISNASDACDKLRYEAIAAPELISDGAPPIIRIKPDKKANTLAVVDSGIGMDRQELIDNLGTIARSGTKSFVARLTEAKDGANLIGQFGVGFYAAFMVAERIVVTSRRAGTDQAWTWSSSGGSGFEIAPAGEDDGQRVARGTEIVLHLKKDAAKYLETYEIERIVRAYSDNIQFPIELVPEEGEPRQINSASALWQRSKSELTAEDYKQAYQSIAGAFDKAVRPVRPGTQGQGQALCPPRLHRRRRRSVAGLSAFHSRRDRQRGSAAEYFPRNAAEQSAAGANPQGRHRPRDRGAGNARRQGAGDLR